MAHNEPSHLDLHHLLSSLNSKHDTALIDLIFFSFADVNFAVCFFALKDRGKVPQISLNIGTP